MEWSYIHIIITDKNEIVVDTTEPDNLISTDQDLMNKNSVETGVTIIDESSKNRLKDVLKKKQKKK